MAAKSNTTPSLRAKRGDPWSTKDRLWLVVEETTHRPLLATTKKYEPCVAVFTTRKAALEFARAGERNDRVIRLGDIAGEIS